MAASDVHDSMTAYASEVGRRSAQPLKKTWIRDGLLGNALDDLNGAPADSAAGPAGYPDLLPGAAG